MFLLISGKAWGPAGRVGQARRETGNLLAGWRGPDKDADKDADAMLENTGPQRSALPFASFCTLGTSVSSSTQWGQQLLLSCCLGKCSQRHAGRMPWSQA